MSRWLLMLLAVGCGRPRGPAAGPDCPTVATHLVELAERDNGGATSEGSELRAELDRSCRDSRWSAERRDCLLAAPDQEATLDCPLE